MSVRNARELDRRLAVAAAFDSGAVYEALCGSPVETTARVLVNLLTAITELKDGVLSTAEAGNLYATSALLRVFLEHTLKALTIFLKATDDRSDEFAKSYERLVVSEARQYRTALRDAKLEAVAAETFFAPWFEEAEKLNRPDTQAMEEPFKHKNMVRTVNDLLGDTGVNFLTKIIPNYSELSGFVHGGPSAAMMMAEYAKANLTAWKLGEIAMLTVDMTYSVDRYLLELAAAVRPEVIPLRDRLDRAIESSRETIPHD